MRIFVVVALLVAQAHAQPEAAVPTPASEPAPASVPMPAEPPAAATPEAPPATPPGDAVAPSTPPAAPAAPPHKYVPIPATPPPPIPDHRLYLTDLTLLRLNPTGLETQLRFGYQYKLFDSDSLALRDNFVYGGTFVRLNPAGLRTAAVIEVQPVSLLNLRFTAEYLKYFGTVGYIQSAPTADVDFSDTALKDAEDDAYGASGVHATFEPLLQVKVGPIAIRDRATFGWFDMDLRAGDRVWYEATFDAPVPGEGWVIANDLDLLFVSGKGLATGPRYTAVFPQYTDAQSPDDTDTAHHRLGLLFAYTFFDDGYTKFNKPTLVLIASWYLKHRYRTGEDVSQAMPYLVAGFAFTSDLLGGPPPITP